MRLRHIVDERLFRNLNAEGADVVTRGLRRPMPQEKGSVTASGNSSCCGAQSGAGP